MAIETELQWFGDEQIDSMNDGMVRFLIRGTNLVQGTAKLLVPVDEGTLKRSIVKAVDSATLKGTVSTTNIEYAGAVEFGIRSNPNYPKQPFMRPALNDNIDKLKIIAIQEGSNSVNN